MSDKKKKKPPPKPTLGKEIIFHPLAWLQYQWFCQRGPTEVAAYGVARHPSYPLYVTDMAFIKQKAYAAYVELDDDAVSTHLNKCMDQGLAGYQSSRIWCHTHPSIGANPSGTDEQTFDRIFSHCDWGVMMILCKSGAVTCRLREHFRHTILCPFGKTEKVVEVKQRPLEVKVAWSQLKKSQVDPAAWEKIYQENIERPDTNRHIISTTNEAKSECGHKHGYYGQNTNPHSWGKAKQRPIVKPPTQPLIRNVDLPLSSTDLVMDRELDTFLKAILPFSVSNDAFVTFPPGKQRQILVERGVTITQE